ncbi:MAG: ATP-dependent helicase, partial [Aeromicrobium sp.]
SGIAVTFVDWADMTRWQLINKELDLPFPQPQETYSTSEHLFHDLGIAHDVKGRLKPAAPKEPRKDAPKGRGGRPQQKSQQQDSGAMASEGGQNRNRNRRRRNRTRSGQAVSKSSD